MNQQSIDEKILKVLWNYYQMHLGDPEISLQDLQIALNQVCLFEEMLDYLHELDEQGLVKLTLTENATMGLVSLTTRGRKVIKQKKQDDKTHKQESEPTPFYVMTIAMTNEEANKLLKPNSNKKENSIVIQELLRLLADCGYDVDTFVACYKEQRDDWEPLITNKASIKTIIKNIVTQLQQTKAVSHQFISNDFFNPQEKKHQMALNNLNTWGGIVIIDAITLFNLELQQHFIHSQIQNPHANISIVVVSPPLSQVSQKLHHFFINSIYTKALKNTFFNFKTEFNINPEFSFDGFYELEKRLTTAITKVFKLKTQLPIATQRVLQNEADIFPQDMQTQLPGGSQ